jgi:hypothetical protein
MLQHLTNSSPNATGIANFAGLGPIATGTPASRSDQLTIFGMMVATAAGLGLIFQIGHFAEHAFQFAVWVLGDLSNICGRNTPWMSPWANDLVQQIGAVFTSADAQRRMMLGMEVLHLIGNSIFLVGLASLYYCVRSKWVRWALNIETFHLYEHISLTATAYFLGKPIGMSTLFGAVNVIGEREFAVGCRVTWHFVMNLLPMPFAMVGLMEYLRERKTAVPT